MNIIATTGGRVKEREIAEKAVEFCIKKLMPRMRTLDITVEFEKLDAFGYCMQEHDRIYTLSIRKGMNLFDLIGTICHEMVHVKQYARKELRNTNGRTMWKKKDHSNTNYEDAPWEKEAYKLEKGLALECFEKIEIKP
jgi:hypothetical protein